MGFIFEVLHTDGKMYKLDFDNEEEALDFKDKLDSIRETSPVYVLGNAPSLLKNNLTKLENETTIGCNHLWKSKFVPTFYCVWDANFFNQLTSGETETFLKMKTKFLFSHQVYLYLEKRDLLKSINQYHYLYLDPTDFFETTCFDLTLKKSSFTKGVITSLSIPLAVSLGATEIVLLGVEAGFKDTNELLHFYKEVDHSEIVAKKLGVPYVPLQGHSEIVRKHTEEVWCYTNHLLTKHGIKLNLSLL